ncbi:MAG: hypothetical protein AABX70_00115 [Nanoarchaeota archaeon]
MPRYQSLQEAYEKCQKEGLLRFQEEIDTAKIKHMITLSQADVDAAKQLSKSLPKESIGWNTIYKLHYDALHSLTEAFLRFNRIKSSNHQCLFAHLCHEHLELEFNWNLFEKIRTQRNGILYYGTPIAYEDWKAIELQVQLYIKTLREAIEKKLEKLVL